VECGSPGIDGKTDNGLYAWRDCNYAGSAARWNVSVSAGGSSWSGYTGIIESTEILSAVGDGLEPNDLVDSTPGDNNIDFSLFVGGSGIDTFQVDVPNGSQTCLLPADLPPGVQVYIGSERMPMSGGVDLLTLQSCVAIPPPAVDPLCEQPTYDATSEKGLFIWRNCDAPGAAQVWSIRASGGGAVWDRYQGSISGTDDGVVLASTYSLEGSDYVDTIPNDNVLDYQFYVGGSGQDGMAVSVPQGVSACFDPALLPVGAQVYVGGERQVIAGPFDLGTQGACN
jgi:hypothetical protein